jgi:hypothetical protein
MGAGANIYGSNTLELGLIGALLIIPIFIYRHYFQDKGKFPAKMLSDLHVSADELEMRKAGALPYLTVLGGALVVTVAWWYYWT